MTNVIYILLQLVQIFPTDLLEDSKEKLSSFFKCAASCGMK